MAARVRSSGCGRNRSHWIGRRGEERGDYLFPGRVPREIGQANSELPGHPVIVEVNPADDQRNVPILLLTLPFAS
ncbi:hypothetical protein ACFUIV_36475 [Streptomyces anulatus]|uniref:hypothetical protein n=1 Tax=Streptomyces anulatus TaxID=1892 RepID=UPI0036385B48